MFVHLFNLKQKLARTNDIVIKFVYVRACCQLRARDMSQRMEIEAIYSPKTEIHAEAREGDPEAKQVLHDDDVVGNARLEQNINRD